MFISFTIVAYRGAADRQRDPADRGSRLAGGVRGANRQGRNWCAPMRCWASRQAGRTIRVRGPARANGTEARREPLGAPSVRDARAVVLGRGLFERKTRLKRLMSETHTPFDAFRAAQRCDAVAAA